MHLSFIAHTRAHLMYVTIACMRLKHALCFISFRIVLISVQDDGDSCESTSKDELPQSRGSLANNIPLRAIKSKPIKSFDKTIAIHNTRQTHNNFRIFKFCVLFNFVY